MEEEIVRKEKWNRKTNREERKMEWEIEREISKKDERKEKRKHAEKGKDWKLEWEEKINKIKKKEKLSGVAYKITISKKIKKILDLYDGALVQQKMQRPTARKYILTHHILSFFNPLKNQ